MSNALIEVAPFEDAHEGMWDYDEKLLAAKQDREAKIIAKVETEAERKQRLKAEEALAKLEAERQAKLAGVTKLNHLWDNYGRTLKHEERARWHLAHAEEYLASIVPTLEQWYFDGGHPNLGKDAPPQMSIEYAMRGYGAQRVVDAFPGWLEKHKAHLAQLKQEIIALARELHLEKELPKGFIQ